MIFNLGAPSNMDLWDMKPDAPAEIRGPFKPVDTTVPGIQLSEILPRHAKIADKFSLVRSVHHGGAAVHDAGWQMMQTGRLFSGGVNTPHLGSAVGYLRGRKTDLPPFAVLPELMGRGGGNMPNGQAGGFLGKAHDPFVLNADPSKPSFRVPDLLPPAEIGTVRLDRRRKIRELVDDAVDKFEATENAALLDNNFQAAFRLMTSPQARAAFDLSQESPVVPRALRQDPVRPVLPAGPPADRERRAVRDDQHVPDRVRRDHLGHPRLEAVHLDRGHARHRLPDVRPGLHRPDRRPRRSGACSTRPWSATWPSSAGRRASTPPAGATTGRSATPWASPAAASREAGLSAPAIRSAPCRPTAPSSRPTSRRPSSIAWASTSRPTLPGPAGRPFPIVDVGHREIQRALLNPARQTSAMPRVRLARSRALALGPAFRRRGASPS